MRFGRSLPACLLLVPLLAAPALAADMGNRLVVGGASGLAADPLRSGFGETRAPILSHGGFSLGAVADTTPPISALGLPYASGRGSLAVGGYVAYGMGEMRLSSSLRTDGSVARADISAAAGLGAGNMASLRLGGTVARPQEFSLNPLQPGMAYSDMVHGSGDINLSLSLTRQVTPAFAFGGTAEASRSNGVDGAAAPGFMLGAGMGYRF